MPDNEIPYYVMANGEVYDGPDQRLETLIKVQKMKADLEANPGLPPRSPGTLGARLVMAAERRRRAQRMERAESNRLANEMKARLSDG